MAYWGFGFVSNDFAHYISGSKLKKIPSFDLISIFQIFISHHNPLSLLTT
jgi:hypothetical protein